jgi:hypothetical protein
VSDAPRTARVPRLTTRSVIRAAAFMGAFWGGGMALVFAGPFVRVTPTQGGVAVDVRERTLPQLVRVVVPYALGGVAFGGIMGGVLLLATRKARADSTAMLAGAGPLEPGERFLEDGPTNRQQRVAVGGWLYLTDRRLLFRPHGMNLGFGSALDLPLGEIADVTPYNAAWIFPTGLRITRRDGTTERFVVWQGARAAWLLSIREAAQLPG